MQAVPLLLLPIGENQPAVERSRPLCAAATGLDPDIRRRSLDHVAKPSLLVPNKSRQAHPMRRVLARVWGVITFRYLAHTIHLFTCAVNRIW